MTICHQSDSFIGPDGGGGTSGGEKVVNSQMFRISSRSTKLSIILIFFKCLSMFKSHDQWHT